MSNWSDNIRKVDPYVPGEQPKQEHMVKLNTNENPYPPAPGVKKALQEFNPEQLRLYPDYTCSSLIQELACYYDLEEEQIFVGVGSDDVLATAFLTCFNSEKPILFPDITYSFYDVWANLYRIPYERPKLDANLHIVKEEYYRDNGGVVIANPNAPTSVCESLDVIEDIIRNNQDVVVIVDEAYVDFGGSSARTLLDRYDNVMVVQTFSKSRSMAGLRIGFCMASKKLIQAMNQVKFSINSYTMNDTALAIGIEAVKDVPYFEKRVQQVIQTRERMKSELSQLGFEFPDSKTNFLFITHKKVDAKELFEYLKQHNIFVRYFSAPRIDQYLRVTIGTEEQMDLFLSTIKGFLKEYSGE